MSSLQIAHLYVSAGHNFFGHNGQPPGSYPMEERPEIQCVAGRGIEGDRFLDYKSDYKGQITFFEEEVFFALREQLGVVDRQPSSFRRNVITRGAELSQFYGREFEVQGVRFLGVSECKPCYWMDEAFAPGAEVALQGRGGLRAKILTSGRLAVDAKVAALA